MNSSFNLKSIFESFGTLPLLLIGFASMFKFGYYFKLDALWILPALPIQGMVYSIIFTVMLFAFGFFIGVFSAEIGNYFGGIFQLIILCFVGIIIIGIVLLKFDSSALVEAVPILGGVIYSYTYILTVDSSSDSGHLSLALIGITSILLLFIVFNSGAKSANINNLKSNLNVVLFEEQSEYPNSVTDWRLLENLGDKLVLINLHNYEEDTRYPMRIVEAKEVKLIY